MVWEIDSINLITMDNWFGNQVVIGEPPVATGCLEYFKIYYLVNLQCLSLNSLTWSKLAKYKTDELGSCKENSLIFNALADSST